MPAPDGAASLPPEAADRMAERQRAEMRAPLGFREARVAVAETRDHGRPAEKLQERCRALRIEPPIPDRGGRIVRDAVRAYENRLYAATHARLPPEMRERFDAAEEISQPNTQPRFSGERGRVLGGPDHRG